MYCESCLQSSLQVQSLIQIFKYSSNAIGDKWRWLDTDRNWDREREMEKNFSRKSREREAKEYERNPGVDRHIGTRWFQAAAEPRFRSHSRRRRGFRQRFPLPVPRRWTTGGGTIEGAKGSQDGGRRSTLHVGTRLITCQNADNSTVWSRTLADILSHGWPRRRAPGPAKGDSSHSCTSATTWTTRTMTASRMGHLWLNRKNDKLVDLRARIILFLSRIISKRAKDIVERGTRNSEFHRTILLRFLHRVFPAINIFVWFFL